MPERPLSNDGSSPPLWTVAVRALCEFTAKTGDLDLRFTPAPTALEGQAGHARVAARRGSGYQTEVPLKGRFGPLQVRGRADGWDPSCQRLDEIKTHRSAGPDALPETHRALHWAQVRCYGALLCAERGLPEIELALVYLHVGTNEEVVLTERASAEELQAFLNGLCARFLGWAEQESAHRHALHAALGALAFPHDAFRPGQRELATAVYRAAASGRCLLAQAPTGIGKTVGTLFPLLKAVPGQGLDKVFFLSAKTSGRAVALRALARVTTPREPVTAIGGLPLASTSTPNAAPPPSARVLRVLELVARDKACVHPDLACHGESCPRAAGFYDRLPAARQAAVEAPGFWDAAGVQALAEAHTVCPYYLSQELVRWADAVVGDYNHWFDLGGLLHGLTQSLEWRVGVLVDEAHNLVDRARQMYTAELSPHTLRAAVRSAPKALHRPLKALQRQWAGLDRDAWPPVEACVGTAAGSVACAAPAPPAPPDYAVLPTLPQSFLGALQRASGAVTEYSQDHPTEVHPELLSWQFEALHFLRLHELDGDHSLLDLQRSGRGATSAPASRTGASRTARLHLPTLTQRNVLPAPFLRPRFEAAHTVTLFSATLQPPTYHRRLLGLPDTTAEIHVPTPFRPEQLQVVVARHLSTRWADRARSEPKLVARIAAQFQARPGNYLAFFSSHTYLQDVARRFAEAHPELPIWLQSRGMSEGEQAAFLARFTPEGQGIGFAVLGGAFAEGVDLPGRRLIGAFIATLGLPQVNPVNEQFRQRLDTLLGAGQGDDCTYLYPGLQKVVQAAGRVIRTPEDTGVIHLLDDRYARRAVQALLPEWWDIRLD